VGSGTWNNVAGSEGQVGDVVHTLSEGREDGLVGDLQDGGWVELAVVKDRLDVHLVLERSDLQLVEESSLRSSNLVTLSDNLDGVNDFDLTFNNLGLDVQSLEERGLLGVETGRSRRNGDISGSKRSNLGWGLSHLSVDDGSQISEVAVSEDHSGVEVKLFGNDLEMVASFPVLLGRFILGLCVKISESSLHKSVLSTDHLGANLSEGLSHDANLLGGNVVNIDKESSVVLLDGLL